MEKITVRVVTDFGAIIPLEVRAGDSVNSVKCQIFRLTQVRPDSHQLIYDGQPLKGELPLSHYGIQREVSLHMVVSRGPGGAGGGCPPSSLSNFGEPKEHVLSDSVPPWKRVE